MDPWALLATARVARLATLSARTGAPTLVPITFAIADGGKTIVHAVDHKPKATRALARLDDVAADPRAAILADHYDDEDWAQLWWVRADGRARILDGGAEAAAAIELLVERYPQYREHRPAGPVVALDVEAIKGWDAR
jgi:PPOX class probable F420-dependent enzyme